MFGLDDALGWIPGIIGAGASFFGQQQANTGNRDIARMTNENNLRMSRETNAFNERMAHNAMAFGERMSSTAYQRSMQDMKQAGLNPILAYSKGGASTPSAPSTSGTAVGAQTGAPMQSTTRDLGSALQSFRLRNELDNLVKTNEKISSDTNLNKQLIETSKRQADLNQSSARQAEANADQIRQLTTQLRTQLPGAQNKEAWDKSAIGKVLTSMSHTLRAFNPFASSALDLSRLVK